MGFLHNKPKALQLIKYIYLDWILMDERGSHKCNANMTDVNGNVASITNHFK